MKLALSALGLLYRPPPMTSHPEQIEFIRLYGPALTECAKAGYREKGRGMVCILCEAHTEGVGLAPYNFVHEISASKLFIPWYGTKEARLVSGYDPAQEMIVIFVRKLKTEGTNLESCRCIRLH